MINSILLTHSFFSLKLEKSPIQVHKVYQISLSKRLKKNSKVKFKNRMTTWRSRYHNFIYRKYIKQNLIVSSVKYVELLLKIITNILNIKII